MMVLEILGGDDGHGQDLSVRDASQGMRAMIEMFHHVINNDKHGGSVNFFL